MTEELQLFCEDMDEQLSIMEDTLMDMSEISIEAVDSEMINKLFRAMHTMKGNAGMFGFDDVVSFAHVAENLLDQVRNKKIVLTQAMLELFLLVNDHSRTLIDVTVQDEQLDDDQLTCHNDILAQLSAFSGLGKPDVLDLKSDKKESEAEEAVVDKISSYHITIKPKDSFFKSDMDIMAIIKYLGVIGDVTNLTIEDSDIPDIKQLEPLKSYLTLSMQYQCEEPIDEIVAAFEFVKDDIDLSIININEKIETENTESVEPAVVEPSIAEKAKPTSNALAKPIKKKETRVEKNFSLRVDSSKVDQLINLISEMVIANAKITQIADMDDNIELLEAADTLTSMLEEIRTGVMDIRMVQVGSSFNKLRRIVNDTAKKLGKQIEFVISGEDTELDKSVVEKISDPLVHMLRNSVDHGIESMEKRIANGKKEKGRIDLRAYPDAGSIVIEVEDDGAGIPKEIILAQAIKNKLVSPTAQLTDKEIYNLIFAAGLSTAESVSDVSGRGVGMDVVKRNIEELKGTVDVDSTLGQGSKITVCLPLTLAIIDGFLVQSGDTKFIIPLEMIQECIELTSENRSNMKNNEFINLRGSILPLLDIGDYFDINRVDYERENIIIVNSGNQIAGLIVHELHGEFQTVIKPLGEVFEKISWISGGTILGNGEVALILDVPMLLSHIV
ncbi:MAG: chemotaxis protein CheA [gamma proteobacterium symbiont of Taylorina sp.]|nr:chemotaxis protein CheA [gamma proteobacterium symbiont of Taylorina sp.]